MKLRTFRSLRTLLIAALLVGSGAAQAAANENSALAKPSFPVASLPAPAGGEKALATLQGEQATIVVTLSTECPIACGFIPALNRIASNYAEQGVTLIGLYPSAGVSLRQIQLHQDEFKIAFPVLKDVGGEVCAKLQATVTPEALLFDGKGQLQYRGRIDDRYIRRGGAALKTHRADLEEALRELLAGKAVSQPDLEPIGCPIQSAREERASVPEEVKAASITYSKHIAPILANRCQTCHREGGIGPFALSSYDDASRWAEDIAQFTADRTMPPWKATPGHGEFVNDRRMPQEEIDLIALWLKSGCAEGDSADLPKPRTFAAGWKLGKPDIVLEMPAEYALAAEGEDDYRCFVLPTDFDDERYLVGMEVEPGNPRVVHHVIAFLDTSGQARKLDAKDETPGYPTSGGYPGFLPAGSLGGWAPGNLPRQLPEGMARLLPAGADVVLQVHYHKTGKVEKDRTRIALYFAKKPVERCIDTLPLLPVRQRISGMRIPAGAENHEVRGTMTLPRDVLLVSVTPHMHLLGKDMKVTATLPDGGEVPLVWLQNWDFNWQENYHYKKPIELPAGTRLELVAHYDNSDRNPYNPHRPPQVVTWGENTNDEMCIAFFEFTRTEKATSPEELRPMTPLERIEFFRAARSSDTNLATEVMLRLLEARRLRGE